MPSRIMQIKCYSMQLGKMKEKAARIYLTATPDESGSVISEEETKGIIVSEDTIVTRYQFLYLVGAEIGRKASIIKIPRVLLQWLK